MVQILGKTRHTIKTYALKRTTLLPIEDDEIQKGIEKSENLNRSKSKQKNGQ